MDIPSSSCTNSCRYDVFFSFSGADTGRTFVDHLYAALHQRGIWVFKDDKNLPRGKEIEPELQKAIESSSIAIVVLSENYASSSWCLDELVKIVECRRSTGLIVLPVFYHVIPSDVRNQRGSSAVAFRRHEFVRVQSWRNALFQVGHIAGNCVDDKANGSEAKIIKKIVRTVQRVLHNINPRIHDELVGIDSHVEKIYALMDIDSPEVHLIGIWGLGGIGKTTIARFIYDQISTQFDGCCSFLADVRENSGIHNQRLNILQQHLLSDILKTDIKIGSVYDGKSMMRTRLGKLKVLIVLDDVNHIDQLEALSGRKDWFGPGSQIIITTRDKHVLKTHGVHNIYPMEFLNHDNAVKLFCSRAFKQEEPKDGFHELTDTVVSFAKGLPLALKVFGSFLFQRSIEEWKSEINQKRGRFESKEIVQRLRVSYDALEDMHKEIFLDIACFFKGKSVDYVMDIHPIIGLRILEERDLIRLSDNELCMHDLIEEMGKRIVFEESPKEPGRRSRLWESDDILHTLSEGTGSDTVEGIFLDPSTRTKYRQLNPETFSRMRKLRFLSIDKVQLPAGLHYLSNKLRILDWDEYPLEYLPSSFQPNNLVVLKMRESKISSLWSGNTYLPNLKCLDLSESGFLRGTPNFQDLPKLEFLDLSYCRALLEIHPSIAFLQSLTELRMNYCENVRNLPLSDRLKSLRALDLERCLQLEVSWPDNLGEMKNLEYLVLDATATRKLPSGIEQLKNLGRLRIERGYRKRQESLPFPLGCFYYHMTLLTSLSIINCGIVEESIPSDIGCLSSLERLDLSENDFVSLPASMSKLSHLNYFRVNGCTKLEALPDLPSNISWVYARDCRSLTRLINPPKIYKSLRILDLKGCSKLVIDPSSNANQALVFWHNQIEGLSDHEWRSELQIKVPGREIPSSFMHRIRGHWITIKLPPDWYNNVLGIAVCVCTRLESLCALDFFYSMTTCQLWKNDGSTFHERRPFPVGQMNHPAQVFSDDINLFYIPIGEFLQEGNTTSIKELDTFSILFVGNTVDPGYGYNKEWIGSGIELVTKKGWECLNDQIRILEGDERYEYGQYTKWVSLKL